MPKLAVWFQYIRSLSLALRVIAFEKTDAVTLVVWSAPALLLVLIALMYSASAGIVVIALCIGLFFVFRNAARRNRFRLLRMADTVEFADVGADAESYRQRFMSGVVLQRLGLDDVVRTGQYDAELMEGNRWFFLVRSADGTHIVPFDWIVGIEMATDETTKG